MTLRNTPRVSFIGFGEAGQAIASGLRESGIERIAAWDILFPEKSGERLRTAAEAIGVRPAASAAEAVREADMIISAVTAASSLEAARAVEPHLSGRPYYLDINSVSPGRKQETEKLLGEKARYVDVAVIAAINPTRHRTPMLIAGPHAEAISPLLAEMEIKLSVVGAQTGGAAAIKMIRSVMVKGIEALTLNASSPPAGPMCSMKSPPRSRTIIPASIGRKSRNTIWSASRVTGSAAPPKWKSLP